MTTINPNLTIPSLATYLSQNQTSTTSLGFTQYNTGSSGTTDLASMLGQDDDGDILDISPEAQAMMQQMNASSSGISGASLDNSSLAVSSANSAADSDKAMNGAFDFVTSFFNDSGVDASKLSDQAGSLLSGISSMIKDMSSVSENTAIDSGTAKASNGTRKSFTLQGDNQTMSFSIQYAGGKPLSMAVTNVNGGKAETAVISLSKDSSGTLSGVNVTSQTSTYNSFGGKTGTSVGEPLSFDLYASDSASDSSAVD